MLGVPPLAFAAHYSLGRKSLNLDDDQSKGFFDWDTPDISSSWATIKDKLQDVEDAAMNQLNLPQVARRLPDFIGRLRDSLDFKPGSMGAEVVRDMDETNFSRTSVRIGSDLCDRENEFREKRLKFTKIALSKYIGVDVDDM